MIPIVVQPPCKPNKGQEVGYASDEATEREVLAIAGVPQDNVLLVAVKRLNGVKQWRIVAL